MNATDCVMFITQNASSVWRINLCKALTNFGLLHGKLICFSLMIILSTICISADIKITTGPNEYNVFEESFYFEITWPESLMYTYKLREARNFGGKFNQMYYNVELIRADPDEACQDLYNDVRGAVVLIMRGECSFLTKTKVAERAGAIAAVISDNDESNDIDMIDMVDDKTERTVRIPSFFLLGKDGSMIRQHLNIHRSDRALINIPVNLTGKPLRAAKRPPWSIW